MPRRHLTSSSTCDEAKKKKNRLKPRKRGTKREVENVLRRSMEDVGLLKVRFLFWVLGLTLLGRCH